jgi:hypothetical protein
LEDDLFYRADGRYIWEENGHDVDTLGEWLLDTFDEVVQIGHSDHTAFRDMLKELLAHCNPAELSKVYTD